MKASSTGSGAVPVARDRLYEVLKARILSMEFEPGHFLSENELAAEFGVSRTPAREALRRLHLEGLVQVVPKRGTFVSPLPSAAEIRQIYELREALGGMSARLAAMRADIESVTELRVLLDRLEELGPDQRAARGELSNQFIRKIDHMSGNNLISTTDRNLTDHLFRLSQAVIIKDSMYLIASTEKRRSLVDAIEAGDTDLAESIQREIVRYVRDEALQYLTVGSVNSISSENG